MSNIEIVRKNLGPVTAYKYAVQQGYTGTEQEFAALMASYATVAEEAESARDDAIDAKTAAEAAAQSLVVDDTLTESNQPADALISGKMLRGIVKNDFEPINDITGRFLYNLESGYIRVNSGAITFEKNAKNMRTPKDFPMQLKAPERQIWKLMNDRL